MFGEFVSESGESDMVSIQYDKGKSYIAACTWKRIAPRLLTIISLWLNRSGDIIVMTSRTEMTGSEISPYWWIPASVAAIIMFIYTLVHASMFLDGFLQSCRQYRNEIVKYVHATGPLVAAIHGRITCSTVFDFMDYLHPDVSFDRRRIDRINTSACLILALITAWASVCLWMGIFIINVIQARRSRNLRV